MTSNGVLAWTREVCVCQRKDLSRELVASAAAVLPEDRLLGMPYPKTIAALRASPLVAVSISVGEALAKNGVRVHTLGIDHVSGGIYYFAEGGDTPPKRVQGDLYAAIRHSIVGDLDSSELDRFLDGIMDRMLALFSDGALSEHAVELAALLPPVCEASEELEDLDTIEASLSAADDGDDHAAAKALETSIVDPSRSAESVRFPSPWGTVDLEVQDALVLELMDGDEGKAKFFVLPKRERWLLNPQTETSVPIEAPAASLETERAAAEKAAAEKAAAAKAAAEKAAAEKAAAAKAAAEKAAAEKAAAAKAAAEKAAAAKAAAEKAAAEKAAAEKAAAAKAAAEKAAAAKAAAEKAAAAKAAAEKAAAEKAAAEKAAAEKAAAEKAAAEKAAAEKAAAEKAAAEKAAAEKAAAEKAAAEKAAAEKAAAEKAAAEKAAAEKAAAEKAAAEKAAAEKAAAEKAAAEKAAAEKAAAEKAAAEKAAAEKPAERAIAAPEKRGIPAVVWVVGAVIVAIIAYVVFFVK